MEIAELRLPIGKDLRIGAEWYRIGSVLEPGRHSVAYHARRLGPEGSSIMGSEFVIKHPALTEAVFSGLPLEASSALKALGSQFDYVRDLYHRERSIMATLNLAPQLYVGIEQVDFVDGAQFRVTPAPKADGLSSGILEEIRSVVESLPRIPIAVSPFVPYPSLRSWSSDLRSSGQGLQPDHIVSALRSLVRTVDDLHSQLIVHDDLSSSNVLVREEADSLQVVLIDFDQACSLMEATRIDEPRKFSRTYSLPERSPINFDSDIYQIGALALYLMTGMEGFSSEDIESRTDDSDGHDRWSSIVDSYLNQSHQDQAHPALAWIRSLVVKCTTPHYRNKYHTIHDLRLTINQIRRQTQPRKDFQAFKAEFHRSAEVMTRERLLEEMLAHDDSELLARLTFARQVRRDFELRRSRSRLMSVYGDREDIVHFYIELMGSLAPGSKYQGYSSASLWANHNLGTNGRFLVACRLFAAKGGYLSLLLVAPSAVDLELRTAPPGWEGPPSNLSDEACDLLNVLRAQHHAIGMLDPSVRDHFSVKVLVLDELDPEFTNVEGFPAFIGSQVTGKEATVEFSLRNLVARRRQVSHRLNLRPGEPSGPEEDFIFGVSLRRDSERCSDALHLEGIFNGEDPAHLPIPIRDYLMRCGYES